MNTLGERVKHLRKSYRMSQMRLAAEAGCAQARIAEIESGRNITSKHTIRLANALGVEPMWLAEGSTDKSPQPVVIETGSYDAHRFVRLAIRAGYLAKPETLACSDCGKPATGYDHRDYNRPLDVEPVCRSCNVKRGPAKPFIHINDR